MNTASRLLIGVLLCCSTAASLAAAETNLQRGERVVREAIEALGGRKFSTMEDRTENGRAYSFYRLRLSGRSLATIHTRYLTRPEPPVAGFFGQRERQAFGKDRDNGVLLLEDRGYDFTFRGARPLPKETIERYRDTTLRNVFYILRQRVGEPGMIFDSKGADVFENQPVEIVEIADADNRAVTVWFHASSKLPVKQSFYRRDATGQRSEEVTRYSKYRDVGGGVMWPYVIQRERNGEKIFEIFSDKVEINKNLTDNLFTLSADQKILKEAK